MNNKNYKLMIKKINGRLNLIEKFYFHRLINSDTNFSEEYKQLREVWQKTDPPKIILPNKDIQWQKLSGNLELDKKAKGAYIFKPVITFAMMIVLLVIGVNLYQTYFGYEVYKTQIGEKHTITLSDNSVIEMNANSELKYKKYFRGNERVVELKGEAYFSVQPDVDREFIVYTENARTRVLGTAFNIWSRKSITRLAVHHGKVAFNNINDPKEEDLVLTDNQRVVCEKNNQPGDIQKVNTESVMLWRKGGFYFEETALHEIIAEIERQFNLSVMLDKDIDSAATMTGSFENISAEKIIEAISLSFNFKLEKKGNNYFLKK